MPAPIRERQYAKESGIDVGSPVDNFCGHYQARASYTAMLQLSRGRRTARLLTPLRSTKTMDSNNASRDLG